MNPQKSPTGQRTYRSRDLQVAFTIKRLLYGEKYTIAGAVLKLQELDSQDLLDPLPGTKPKAPAKPSFQEVAMKVEGAVEGPAPRLEKPNEKLDELFKLIQGTKEILGKYPILR